MPGNSVIYVINNWYLFLIVVFYDFHTPDFVILFYINFYIVNICAYVVGYFIIKKSYESLEIF